jgi:hypothetical protein
MSATFILGDLEPEVTPRIAPSHVVLGENVRTQTGALYSTASADRLAFTLSFERLTYDERLLIESYCMALPGSLSALLVMNDRGRLFDGETVDGDLGRVLNKVKIVGWTLESATPYDDSDGVFSAEVQVEES